MTRLLVSVRNAQEAEQALRGGAGLIDVKEPRRGSLGCASARQWRDVVCQVSGRVPVSVALGELLEPSLPRRVERVLGVAYAKCGLAGCARRADWSDRWRSVVERLTPRAACVAVTYVDWRQAAAPPPSEVLDRAGQIGCRAMLWDTYRKGHGCLLDYLAPGDLEPLIGQARDQHMLVVLAGSLALSHLPDLLGLKPDYVAVRGAVCAGTRTDDVCVRLVQQWSRVLRLPAGGSSAA